MKFVSKSASVVQVAKSGRDCTESARDEIRLCKCVRDSDPSDPYGRHVVELLDDFTITGVNGRHVCMVFEVQGHSLMKLIAHYRYRGLPISQVKNPSNRAFVLNKTIEIVLEKYYFKRCIPY